MLAAGAVTLMAVLTGCRVNTQVAGQLKQDGLSLGPELGGRALDTQGQDMIAAAGKLVPRGPRSPGPAAAPDLSDIPAQAQGVDYLECITGPRHALSPFAAVSRLPPALIPPE